MYAAADRYKRERQLRQAGIDPEPGQIELHNSRETVLHAVVKLLVCREIHSRGRPFATELELPDGSVADVLDYGSPDGYAVVYEVESEPTPSRTREKVEQYTRPWIIRDVLVLDLRDAPTDLMALSEGVSEHVVGKQLVLPNIRAHYVICCLVRTTSFAFTLRATDRRRQVHH